jgi:hypothetical protein
MAPYTEPVLHDLGRMGAVTQKTGPTFDIGGEPEGTNVSIICQFFPFLNFCQAQSGPSGSSGSGSF